jgi:hypothetical protein
MSETPLLDAMLAEAEGRLSISELRTPVNYTENLLETYPPTKTNTGDCNHSQWFAGVGNTEDSLRAGKTVRRFAARY